MKQFWALNFEIFRRGKGEMNFCLGRGCLVKGISLCFAVYLVNGRGRKLFGSSDLQDVCVGYLLFGRACVRISRAVFIVKSWKIHTTDGEKRVRQHRKLFSLFIFLPI